MSGYFESIILRDLAGNVASISIAGAVSVDGSGVTQPVSVTVLPLPTGAATEATLAALNTQAGNLATEATLANIKTAVEIIDNFISGSRGLVTEDNSLAIKTAVETIDNFISGSRGLVTEDNSAAILTALGTIITSLAGTLTISGNVTANAGTNLNTSALALEATLQSVKTAVETIDNFISGSKGLVTEDNSAAIKTAVELIDDAIYTDGSGTVVKGIAILGQDGTNPQAIKTDSNGELQIDVLSSALPSGAATAANQATIIGHVDGIEALLTTIDADTSNISTKIDTIAGAVSGAEMQVDVLTMPIVTVQATDLDIRDLVFATDKVDASGSVVIISGSVAVTGPLTDAQLRATPVPVDTELPAAAALADNTANPTAPAVGAFGMIWDGANWDRTPGNQTDGLLVNLGANNDVTVTSSALPSGAATAANQATIIGHVDGIEALLTTIDADTSNISTKIDTIAGAVSGTEMQVDVLTLPALPTGTNTIGSVKLTDGTDTAAITAAGELSVLATAQPGTDIGDVTINNASGGSAVNIQDGGNSITVDNGGTFVVQENGAALTSLQLIDDTVYTDNAGFTDNSSKILGVGYVFDETAGTALTENDIAAARIDSKRAIVNVLEDGTTRGLRQGVVDETGTNAVDAAAVGGGTPHDSVDSGNPIKIGGKAVAHGSNPSAVAAGDRSNAYTNVHGIPFAIGGHPNIQSAEYYTTAAQTDDNILPAISTGTIYVITCITVTASAANTVNTSVRIGFGTANVPTQGSSGADGVAKMILSHPGIAPGSGIVKGTGSGIVGIGGDGEELRITNSAPTTGSLIVQVDYFTISV